MIACVWACFSLFHEEKKTGAGPTGASMQRALPRGHVGLSLPQRRRGRGRRQPRSCGDQLPAHEAHRRFIHGNPRGLAERRDFGLHFNHKSTRQNLTTKKRGRSAAALRVRSCKNSHLLVQRGEHIGEFNQQAALQHQGNSRVRLVQHTQRHRALLVHGSGRYEAGHSAGH